MIHGSYTATLNFKAKDDEVLDSLETESEKVEKEVEKLEKVENDITSILSNIKDIIKALEKVGTTKEDRRNKRNLKLELSRKRRNKTFLEIV